MGREDRTYYCKKSPKRHGANDADPIVSKADLRQGLVAWADVESSDERQAFIYLGRREGWKLLEAYTSEKNAEKVRRRLEQEENIELKRKKASDGSSKSTAIGRNFTAVPYRQ